MPAMTEANKKTVGSLGCDTQSSYTCKTNYKPSKLCQTDLVI